MATKLIRLNDGTLVEAEVPRDSAQEISGGFAEKVSTTWDTIEPILAKITQPIANSLQTISQSVNVESVEVEVGLSFEGEGNLYITKSKAAANLKVKLSLKPKR